MPRRQLTATNPTYPEAPELTLRATVTVPVLVRVLVVGAVGQTLVSEQMGRQADEL